MKEEKKENEQENERKKNPPTHTDRNDLIANEPEEIWPT